jgi:hypothetical protein
MKHNHWYRGLNLYCHDFIKHSDTAPDYILQFTITHRLLSTAKYPLPFLGSGFQTRTFRFLWVPELFPASATKFSQQQLTISEPQRLSNLPTNPLTPLTDSSLTCPSYNISSWTAQETLFLCAVPLLSSCLLGFPRDRYSAIA